jgi:hypothetical protein
MEYISESLLETPLPTAQKKHHYQKRQSTGPEVMDDNHYEEEHKCSRTRDGDQRYTYVST